MFNNPRSPARQAPVRVISGQFISKARVSYQPWRRAKDAVRWINGEVQIEPTVKLAAEVFCVPVSSVRAMLEWHRAHKPHINGGADGAALSDAVVDRIVKDVGPDRILHALDRVMSPELPLQAAE